MATVRLSNAAKADVLGAINTRLNAGSGPGQIRIYTGTMPATPNTAITSQLLLGTLTLSDPAGVVNGSYELVFNTITGDTQADDNGVATWARLVDSDNNPVIDIDISVTGGSGALQMNTTNIVVNGPININSFKVTA